VPRTAIIYHSFQLTDNVRHFLKHGVFEDPDYHYYFIINDPELSYGGLLQNAEQYNRPNQGLDFGGYSEFVQLRREELQQYDYLLFLNQTLIGPLLPIWYPQPHRWPDLFTAMLTDEVKLAGISTSYQISPHVQSTLFCMDQVGFTLLCDHGIFNPEVPEDKWQLILEREIGMSQVILRHNYNIAGLLKQDHHVDFRTGPPELHGDPWHYSNYLGKTPHPYETIFVKTNTPKYVNFDELINLHR